MGRVDPQILALFSRMSPLWIAALSAALLVLTVWTLVVRRSRKGFFSGAGRFFLVMLTAGLSASLIWGLLDNTAVRDRDAERSALKLREGELTAQVLSPGSPLACLDALAGDTVQAACERSVFATPANVASAVAYVAAQYALMSDMTAFSKRGGAGIDDELVPLQRALEADPFGFLAHVLVRRDGCTSEHCQAFALLHDPSHVRTNIIAQTLEHYVDHYREVWARTADTPVAGMADFTPTGAADPSKRKVSVNIDFPSADSIPPISIMNPEPKTSPAAEAARKRAEKPKDSGEPVWRPAAAAPAQAAAPARAAQ
jgi:hypothetical protein